MVPGEGLEPSMFLVSQFYRLLPSPLGYPGLKRAGSPGIPVTLHKWSERQKLHLHFSVPNGKFYC